jgi:hypothetical protein
MDFSIYIDEITLLVFTGILSLTKIILFWLKK